MKHFYLSISYGWERAVDAGCGGGHGQECGDGEHHPGGGRLVVQPKGHPGDADSHEGWHIDGEHVVGELKQIIFSNIDNGCILD